MVNTQAAGYSGTPLAKKLGIKAGMAVVVVDPPENYLDLVAPLPEGVALIFSEMPDQSIPAGAVQADLFHIFTNTRNGMLNWVDKARKRIRLNGAIWVSWYKKASKLATEITEDDIRNAALQLGLVDVKVCAVDENWSGLKLVIRKENRI